MGAIVEAFAEAFRNYVTDGLPASGPNNPSKEEIRSIGSLIESAINNATLGSMIDVVKSTKADLDADLAHDADTVAFVYADPDDANNDLYIKVGASGSGSWTNTNAFHDVFASVAASILDTYPKLAGGGKFMPFDDSHNEAGSWSAIAGYPNFLLEFVKGVWVYGIPGHDYGIQAVDISPTVRRIVILDRTSGSQCEWRDTTDLGGSPDYTTMPHRIKLEEEALAISTGLFAVMELDWSVAVGNGGNGPYTTKARSGLHQDRIFSLGEIDGYLDNHVWHQTINVGPTKASFIGVIADDMLTASSSSGRITLGLLLSGSGVASGTTIYAYGTGTGGDGTYYLNKSQTVSSTAMTVGREYTDLTAATQDIRCVTAHPYDQVRILLDGQGGTVANPVEYPVQALALPEYVGIVTTGREAAIVPSDEDSSDALIEMTKTSKLMYMQMRPTKGYAVHPRPGSVGGQGGFGITDRKKQGIYGVLIASGPAHNTRHIAGDASAGHHLRLDGVQSTHANVATTESVFYMHNSAQNGTYPNLAQSEGMRFEVWNCSGDLPQCALVEGQTLDDANQFNVINTIDMRNSVGKVLLRADASNNQAFHVTGIHDGPIISTAGTPEIENGRYKFMKNTSGSIIPAGRAVKMTGANTISPATGSDLIYGWTVASIANNASGNVNTAPQIATQWIDQASSGTGEFGVTTGGQLSFAATPKRGTVWDEAVSWWN